MTDVLVADAGPLIALAKTGHLNLLRELCRQVWIPQAVLEELGLPEGKPGTEVLSKALGPEGWIGVQTVDPNRLRSPAALGSGEREAIALALEHYAVLLMDDYVGRKTARALGVTLIGTGRILLAAKDRGLIDSVTALLGELTAVGYRLSPALVREIKELAGEAVAGPKL
jgi:predicted nucleic acid-binding protein